MKHLIYPVIMAEITPPEALRDNLITPNNPKAGAEFLYKTPKGQVLVSLFSFLQTPGNSQEKVNALLNIKKSLDDPSKSGLSENIIESPDMFFDKIILQAKGTPTPLSPQAQSVLDIVRKNFNAALEKKRISVITGNSTEILTRGVNPKYLIEALKSAVLDKKQPEEFRVALAKTFLNLVTTKPDASLILFSEGRPPQAGQPPRNEAPRQPQRPDIDQQKDLAKIGFLETEVQRLQMELGDKNFMAVRQQGRIRELEQQLDQTRLELSDLRIVNGRKEETSRMSSRIPPLWHEVLGVQDNATPEQIRKAYAAKFQVVHPDHVLAALNMAGVDHNSVIYREMKKFAEDWTNAVSNAKKQAERSGRLT